uniref:MARVEL domain-containing protein n=1 Tax=Cyclopterus lumpus TaxID=8103 RepID=A0A8C2WYF5_CYCLU
MVLIHVVLIHIVLIHMVLIHVVLIHIVLIHMVLIHVVLIHDTCGIDTYYLFQEFFHYSVGSVLIVIASIVAAVKSGGVSALVAGSVFGFIATFLMAVSLWTSYSVTCGHQTGAAV